MVLHWQRPRSSSLLCEPDDPDSPSTSPEIAPGGKDDNPNGSKFSPTSECISTERFIRLPLRVGAILHQQAVSLDRAFKCLLPFETVFARPVINAQWLDNTEPENTEHLIVQTTAPHVPLSLRSFLKDTFRPFTVTILTGTDLSAGPSAPILALNFSQPQAEQELLSNSPHLPPHSDTDLSDVIVNNDGSENPGQQTNVEGFKILGHHRKHTLNPLAEPDPLGPSVHEGKRELVLDFEMINEIEHPPLYPQSAPENLRLRECIPSTAATLTARRARFQTLPVKQLHTYGQFKIRCISRDEISVDFEQLIITESNSSSDTSFFKIASDKFVPHSTVIEFVPDATASYTQTSPYFVLADEMVHKHTTTRSSQRGFVIAKAPSGSITQTDTRSQEHHHWPYEIIFHHHPLLFPTNVPINLARWCINIFPPSPRHPIIMLRREPAADKFTFFLEPPSTKINYAAGLGTPELLTFNIRTLWSDCDSDDLNIARLGTGMSMQVPISLITGPGTTRTSVQMEGVSEEPPISLGELKMSSGIWFKPVKPEGVWGRLNRIFQRSLNRFRAPCY